MQLSSGIHDVQKHFALHPYIKLSFNKHTNNKITVATKGICLLRKLWPILPQASLLTIYKYFIKYYLDDEMLFETNHLTHHFQIKLNQ